VALYAAFALLRSLNHAVGSFLGPLQGICLVLSGVFASIAALNGQMWWLLLAAVVAVTILALFLGSIH